jgi:glyoxylase-like metal-dependent hydrolase (beta-lactamase superfamily II)
MRPPRILRPRRAAKRLLCLALAAICLAAAPGMSAAPPLTVAPPWKITAIRYATIPKFPVHDLVTGADTTRTLDIAMMFWLIDGPGRRVLFDAGFYRDKFVSSWKPADFVRPSEALQRLGVSPDSITDVVISHVHWDHLDGADLFPHARIWIQREEYRYYVRDDGTPAHAAIDSLDARMLFEAMHAGRVELEAGDSLQFLPGITAYTGGKHTFASQYLGVRTAKGTVVLASDNCYLYENLERHAPIAQTLDAASNLAAQDRMRRLARGTQIIVPGHDPAVFARFRAVAPGAVAIE